MSGGSRKVTDTSFEEQGGSKSTRMEAEEVATAVTATTDEAPSWVRQIMEKTSEDAKAMINEIRELKIEVRKSNEKF